MTRIDEGRPDRLTGGALATGGAADASGPQVDLAAITNGLTEIEPGLWQGASGGPISYPREAHDECLELEGSSYWFEHRNACIIAAVKRFPPAGTLFDVGGGNGYVARGLVDAGFDVVVVEPGPSGARNARRRGLEPVVCASLEETFRPATLPAVGVFDVIEHVAEDEAFLTAIADRLRPAGRFYATVPAAPWLWSVDDEIAGHARRYTRSGLVELVRRAGFRVEWSTAFFAPLVLPVLLLRALPSRLRLGKALSDEQEFAGPAGALGRILRWSLARELAALARRPRRWGSSLLVVASRR